MQNEKISTVFLGILVVVAAGFVLKAAASVFIPIIIAILFSFMLYPAITAMQKIKIPRIAAIVIVLVLLFGICYLVAVVFYRSISVFTFQFSWYVGQLREMYKDISLMIMSKFDIAAKTDFLIEADWGKIVRTNLLNVSNQISKIIGYIVIVFIFLMFLFIEYPLIRIKLLDAFPRTSKRFIIVISRITRDVGKYLIVKGIISAITGFFTWLILFLMKVDFPVIWGVMAFFLNFVPNLGSIFVVICICIQSIVQFYPSVGMFALVAIMMTALQITLGTIIEPKIQGDRLNLSTSIIIFSLIFWGWLWGPVGALLAVPITVTIKIICLSIPSLRQIGILIGTGNIKYRKFFISAKSVIRTDDKKIESEKGN